MHGFVLIPVDGWTLVPKNGGKSSFSMKPKHQFVYPNEWNEFTMSNHEKKGDYYVNPCLSQLKNEL